MDDWIETSSGGRLSRKAHITCPQNVSIGDCVTILPNCEVVAAELAVPLVLLGKYSFLCGSSRVEGSELRPVSIGNYTLISEHAHLSQCTIGSRVFVGEHAQIRHGAAVGDCCIVEANSVIPPKSVIPPFSRVSGEPPSVTVSPLSPAYKRTIEAEAKRRHFLG